MTIKTTIDGVKEGLVNIETNQKKTEDRIAEVETKVQDWPIEKQHLEERITGLEKQIKSVPVKRLLMDDKGDVGAFGECHHG